MKYVSTLLTGPALVCTRTLCHTPSQPPLLWDGQQELVVGLSATAPLGPLGPPPPPPPTHPVPANPPYSSWMVSRSWW